VVDFNSKGTSGHVHDCGSEAEQRLQQTGADVEENISDEERDGDEEGGTNGDHSGHLSVPVVSTVTEQASLCELKLVGPQQCDGDQAQDDFDNLENSREGAQGADVECETHIRV